VFFSCEQILHYDAYKGDIERLSKPDQFAYEVRGTSERLSLFFYYHRGAKYLTFLGGKGVSVRVNTTIQQKQIASNKNLAETFQF
jgi:hypothetical protein